MDYVTKGYEPSRMLEFFEEISAIPRGSGNEKGIADYLCTFASERGLFCHRDGLHNVLIVREADRECENMPPMALQGHTDMVCDKEASSSHDFERDPLQLYIENGFLKANGTTLGADDGVAVAAMLALLDGAAGVPLPRIECIFTVQEETGLGGALGFDWGMLSARRLMNLDSEQDGEVVVGCCGGERCYVELEGERITADKPLYRIELGGLAGGHSGADIDRGRANANILAGALLKKLSEECGARLAYISGGSKDNAIARECVIEVACDRDITECVQDFENEIREQLSECDSGFAVKISRGESTGLFSADTSAAVAKFILGLPNGVISMCNGLDLPQTSSNLGVIRTEGDVIYFDISCRSSVGAELDATCEKIVGLAESHGMSCERNSRYLGWERRVDSYMEKLYCRSYEDLFGERPRVAVIHAGLECGIISGALPDMDMVSFGPTMHDIHSPSEVLELASCERFWKLILKMLTKKSNVQ